VTESDADLRIAAFTVTLASPSTQTVSVGFSTIDGTAKSSSDYSARSGRLTFSPGTTKRTILVPVMGDVLSERDEWFVVNLTDPSGAPISDGVGFAIVYANDARRAPLPAAVVLPDELESLLAAGLTPSPGGAAELDSQGADSLVTTGAEARPVLAHAGPSSPREPSQRAAAPSRPGFPGKTPEPVLVSADFLAELLDELIFNV
jgi:hypothetical protein